MDIFYGASREGCKYYKKIYKTIVAFFIYFTINLYNENYI